MSNLVCVHGSFSRKCEICERDGRIKELETKVEELEKANGTLGADVIQQLERVTLAEARAKEWEEDALLRAQNEGFWRCCAERRGIRVRELEARRVCRFCGTTNHKENECLKYPEVVRLGEKVKELELQVQALREDVQELIDDLAQTKGSICAARDVLEKIAELSRLTCERVLRREEEK